MAIRTGRARRSSRETRAPRRRTPAAAARALTREPELTVGIVACIQTHGSRANWHPHIHMIVTDGGFRPDGNFGPWPVHDTVALTEALRRAVLRAFVQRGVLEPDDADAMLAWPHSQFHVHDSVGVPDCDTAFAPRLAGCWRNPVAGAETGGPGRVPRARHGPHPR